MTRARWFLPLVLAAILTGIAFARIGLAAEQVSDAKPQLRVLTYNIHHGEAMDGKFDYERLGNVIADLKPDVVGLQEVDYKTQRSGGVDQAELLGRLTRMQHVFGQAMPFQGGGYGIAVLSRFQVEKDETYPLPFRPGQEPRAALSVRIKPGNGLPDFILVNTHLCHQSSETRTSQAHQINQVFPDKTGPPIILVGDLNARSGSETMKELLTERWVDTGASQSMIDYVLTRKGDPWRVIEANIVEELVVSDHKPVLVVLEWTGEIKDKGQKDKDLLFSLDFDEKNFVSLTDAQRKGQVVFGEGIEGKGLDLAGSRAIPKLSGTKLSWFSNSRDFSVSLWVKSYKRVSGPAIIISNSDFSLEDAGIYGERRTNKGITLYSIDGAWGWNIGNGSLHYNYEPIETDQPIADKKWHHIAYTFSASKKEVRLFYDGINKAVFSVGDLDERDFLSDLPLRIGGDKNVSPGDKTFSGFLDEIQVWKCTLSPGDVKNEYSKYYTVAPEPAIESDEFTVVNWNIWHGGTHFTKEENGFDGIERITELLRNAGADIVLMQETYGAGSRISSSLGFYYYEACSTVGAVWGANLSVMSRFPIEDAYIVEKQGNYGNNYAFNSGGITVRLSDQHRVIAFSNWYNGSKPEDLDVVLKTWSGLIANSDKMPIVSGGDFNSVSHLDDGKGTSGHSKLMAVAGFIDSYRELHPDVLKNPGHSNGGASSRIDYIYYRGKGIKAVESGPIVPNFKGKEGLTPDYPSDHLGIVTKFRINSGTEEREMVLSRPSVQLKPAGSNPVSSTIFFSTIYRISGATKSLGVTKTVTEQIHSCHLESKSGWKL